MVLLHDGIFNEHIYSKIIFLYILNFIFLDSELQDKRVGTES